MTISQMNRFTASFQTALSAFKKKLKPMNNFEKDKIIMEVETDYPDAEVKWFKDGQEIKPDGKQ